MKTLHRYLGPLLWMLPVLVCTALAGCSLTREAAVERFGAALTDIAPDHVHSAVMWVDSPRHGIAQGFAAGKSHVATGAAMTVTTPFLSASVGKLFVAAAVLKLVADGKLSLQDPVSRWVPKPLLAGLPVEGGDAAFDQVTIAMLLAHRSGLPDYFSGSSKDGAPRVFDRIVTERDRTWSRQDMLDYTRAHYAPVGPLGTFEYADTNYDLLGLVLEGAAGKPFYQVVRDLVLTPLGLHNTWYHAFEAPPPGVGTPADVWVSGVNLIGTPALSVDQAGGGLVTTVADLRDFLRALSQGRPVPLSALETDFTEDAMHAGIDVGRCAWRIRPGGVFFALGGLPTLVGHSGATGVWAYYVQEWDAVLVGAVSDASWQEKHIEFLLSEVVPVLARTPLVAAANK